MWHRLVQPATRASIVSPLTTNDLCAVALKRSGLSTAHTTTRFSGANRGAWRTLATSSGRDGSPNTNDDKTNTNSTEEVPIHESVLSEDWIPPNRPLSGDKGNSRLYKEHEALYEKEQQLEEAIFVIDENDTDEDILRRLEEALKLEEELEQQQFQQELKEEEDIQTKRANEDAPVDWLATRRAALGLDEDGSDGGPVPVIVHELLTENELVTLLESQGGSDTVVLLDDPDKPRMGGVTGMVLTTAASSFHIRSLTKCLVDHLKHRQLDEVGVDGASTPLFKRSQEMSWNIIDCHNFIVHILDASTRSALNLEELWSGDDALWKLNFQDEDAVDKYVSDHPVPFTYGPNPESLVTDSVSKSIGKLERSHFSPHRPRTPRR